jgi:hypothetical protein
MKEDAARRERTVSQAHHTAVTGRLERILHGNLP